ncbi:hypothetical protein V2G26_013497 [Clonostachys chloroleuca]|uniref:Glutathione S-transferase n=1 Tax=Clonostachys chloroleuca TaxID=1926264 RepID=A0AA35M7P4_9HYPO|nr:unnamed protein product [Clonostachys chloroleuca]
MSELQPLIVYGCGHTPNPWKVVIIIEELGLPYVVEQVDIRTIKDEPYISLNPNGRLPAFKDPNNNDIVLFESGAIIDYIIEVYDKKALLHYASGPEKHITRCWEHFQMSGQGPYFGQKIWFEKFHPQRLPTAIERYLNEMKRVIGVIDSHLAKKGTDYLVGDKVTYADLMFLPYFTALPNLVPELDFTKYPQYNAWLERLVTRPITSKVLERLAEAAAKGTIPAVKQVAVVEV